MEGERAGIWWQTGPNSAKTISRAGASRNGGRWISASTPALTTMPTTQTRLVRRVLGKNNRVHCFIRSSFRFATRGTTLCVARGYAVARAISSARAIRASIAASPWCQNAGSSKSMPSLPTSRWGQSEPPASRSPRYFSENASPSSL